MIDKKIRKTASETRRRIEQYAWSSLTQWCSWHRKQNLRGLCAIASLHLLETLEEKGAPGWLFAYGHYLEKGCRFQHCWLENDTHLIDITACQFETGKRGVRIAAKTDPRYLVQKLSRNPKFPFWARCTNPHGKNEVSGNSHRKTLKELSKKG